MLPNNEKSLVPPIDGHQARFASHLPGYGEGREGKECGLIPPSLIGVLLTSTPTALVST